MADRFGAAGAVVEGWGCVWQLPAGIAIADDDRLMKMMVVAQGEDGTFRVG